MTAPIPSWCHNQRPVATFPASSRRLPAFDSRSRGRCDRGTARL